MTHETSTLAVINSHSGKMLLGTQKPFILVLQQGENLFEAILRCASELKLKSASISGLGGLDDVSVAYYNMKSKQYQTKLFEGMYELISLNGNITFLEGKYFLHIHAALGKEDYSVVGGHIMDAIVNPTVEVSVTPLAASIHRELNAEIGLKLIHCPIT